MGIDISLMQYPFICFIYALYMLPGLQKARLRSVCLLNEFRCESPASTRMSDTQSSFTQAGYV